MWPQTAGTETAGYAVWDAIQQMATTQSSSYSMWLKIMLLTVFVNIY